MYIGFKHAKDLMDNENIAFPDIVNIFKIWVSYERFDYTVTHNIAVYEIFYFPELIFFERNFLLVLRIPSYDCHFFQDLVEMFPEFIRCVCCKFFRGASEYYSKT